MFYETIITAKSTNYQIKKLFKFFQTCRNYGSNFRKNVFKSSVILIICENFKPFEIILEILTFQFFDHN